MASFAVTRGMLSLGNRDATTGWPSKSFSDSTINMHIERRGDTRTVFSAGRLHNYEATGFTDDEIFEGYHITHADGTVFEVEEKVQFWHGDNFVYQACGLKQITPFDATRPSASATWHVDSDSVKTDMRERTKTWMTTYINSGNIGGDYITLFAGMDYPFHLEFTSLGNDGLYIIDAGESTPEYTFDHKPYKFNESVPIHIWTVNKTAKTAPVISEQMEQELRRICTSNPDYHTSLRAITTIKNDRVEVGATTLWHTLVTLRYSRENDDYVATTPTITWGPSATPTGTFIFPNVTAMTLPNINNDVSVFPPGRAPTIWQGLGSEGLEIQLTCDLDIEHTDLTWKRPQTAAKTDDCNFQVFLDIMHNAEVDQNYQTLTTSWGTFKVRLIRMEPALDGAANHLMLTFKEYNASNALSGTYTTRYGIT